MFNELAETYPRLSEFEAFRQEIDPESRFENSSYRRIRDGGYVAHEEAGCVTKRGCYCQVDLDCPKGLRCVQGLVSKDARVCR